MLFPCLLLLTLISAVASTQDFRLEGGLSACPDGDLKCHAADVSFMDEDVQPKSDVQLLQKDITHQSMGTVPAVKAVAAMQTNLTTNLTTNLATNLTTNQTSETTDYPPECTLQVNDTVANAIYYQMGVAHCNRFSTRVTAVC